MPSVISHAVVGLSIGACFYRPGVPKYILAIGAACAAVPDLDVIGFRFGVRYGDFWGHRGFTHSLVFAAALATAIVACAFRRGVPGLRAHGLWAYLFLSTASHGLLDTLTDGGLGVALFSPFNNKRYFSPWRPIVVSPIGMERFFTARGLAVLQSELVWVCLPALLFSLVVLIWRWRSVVQ